MEQRIGDSRYEFRGELSREGRGVTFRAWDRERNIEVALKLLHDLDSTLGLGAFHHDCSLWACISHPNVSELLDSGEIEFGGRVRPFTATPLHAGSSLLDLLRRLGRGLRPELITDVISQASAGLQAFHAQGLLHRNIKLANVLVENGGAVKLLDPGVGFPESLGLVMPRGTTPYMAPELFRMGAASPSTDVYSLGVVCYEALTGARPFQGRNDDEIARLVMEKSPEPPIRLVAGLSPALNAVVSKSISKDPSQRFDDPAQFSGALASATVVPGVSPVAPPPAASSAANAQEQKRSQDIDLLRRFVERAHTPEAEKFFDRIRETTLRIASLYPADAEIESLSGEVVAALDQARRIRLEEERLKAEEAARLAAPPPPLPEENPEEKKEKEKAKRPIPPMAKYGIVGGIFVGLLLAVFVLSRDRSNDTVQVEIRTTPPGARILVAGELRGLSNLILDLPPGEHEAVAELDGHQPASTTFVIQPGRDISLDLKLNTWLTAVKVTSEIKGADPALSSKPLASLSDGEFSLDNVADGDYDLEFESPKGAFKLPLQLASTNLSQLRGAINGRGLRVMVLSMQGERLHIYSGLSGSRAALDGKPMQSVPPDGLEFEGARPGPHQLTFYDGEATRTFPLQWNGAPTLHVFVLARQEIDKGSLLVVTGVDRADVAITGKGTVRKRTQRGSARAAGLIPGEYQVSVKLDGFEPVAARKVKVEAGKEAKVEFAMRAIPRHSTLVVAHEPGTEVFLDGEFVGAVRGEGHVTKQLSPGPHRIELRRGAARSSVLTHEFRSGETYRPSPGLFALSTPDGVVRFEPTPSDARITIRRRNEPESAARPIAQPVVSLDEGDYTIAATAPRHSPVTQNVTVQPGVSITVPVRLAPVQEAPKPVVRGVSDFEDPNGWQRSGAWLVRRGGNYVAYSSPSTAGTITFFIQQRRGKRLQWFLNYSDPRNHAIFRLDRKSFSRAHVTDGRPVQSARKDLGFEPAAESEIRIDIERTRVVHRIRRSGQWVVLDDWQDPAADFTGGKFGFYIPGGKIFDTADEYAIRGFSFTQLPR